MSKVIVKTSVTDKETLVLAAIPALRTDRSKGIHCVYSGFNAAFLKRFGETSRETTEAMAQAGMIVIQPCKGGAMLYLAGEEPSREAGNDQRTDSVLSKIDALFTA